MGAFQPFTKAVLQRVYKSLTGCYQVQYTTDIFATDFTAAVAGNTVNSVHYSSATAKGGSGWKFTGVTTLAKAGGRNADGYVYDAVGRQLQAIALVANVGGALDCVVFGAALDGGTSGKAATGTDDADAINAALTAAGVLGVGSVLVNGVARLQDTLTVPAGVELHLGGHARPVFNNTSGEWVLSGTCLLIDHGNGVSVDAWDSAAIILDGDGANFSGGALVQPAQNMDSTTPTQYPPAIAVSVGNLYNKVSDTDFCNVYSGIDARRDHGGLNVDRVYGCPIYRGIRVGSMKDNAQIHNIHFNPQYAYTGSVSSANSLVDWMFDNAVLLELGSNSYSTYENLFAYNYKAVINAAYQAADSGNGINNAGGTREPCFKNIRADSCKHAAIFDSTGSAGTTNYGVKFYGLVCNLKSAYNPSTKKSESAIKWRGNSTEQGGFQVFGGRVNEADAGVFDVEYARHCELIGFDFWSFANSTSSAVAILLSNTIGFKINGGSADLQGRTSSRLLKLVTENTLTRMSGVTVRDHGGVVDIADSNNSDYHIVDNTFDSVGSAHAVSDSQNDTESIIKNISAENYYILGDADVDANGLLAIPVDEQFDELIRYQGTETINGIFPYRRGRKVTIRFTSACTVTDDSGSVSGAQVLRLEADVSANDKDTLTLVHDNDAWYRTGGSAN